jgi:hypothetical protein
MPVRPIITALLGLMGASALAAGPAASQSVRDSLREPPQPGPSQLAAPPAGNPRVTTTSGTIAEQPITSGDAKAAPFAPAPALGANAK